MQDSYPLLVLRLNDEDGSLRTSLPWFLGRAFELIFSAPNVRFEWQEVRLVEEPKLFIATTSEGIIVQILDHARARGANVSRLKSRMWRPFEAGPSGGS